MKIKFYCPNCNTQIDSDSNRSGMRSKCTVCGQFLIIPSENNAKAQRINPEEFQPVKGFYRSVFLESWEIFTRPASATGLVFVIAAVCFKFFIGHVDYSFTMGEFRFPGFLGQVVTVAAWGCFFWYYMEIIRSTAFDLNELPEAEIGSIFGFIWNVIKSIYIFAVALLIVELPCIIVMIVFNKVGISFAVLYQILALCGLFIFPMVILAISVSRDITSMVRPDYILGPMIRAFKPYLVSSALFLLAFYLQLKVVDYEQVINSGKIIVGLHLSANIAVQVLAIIAMRSIGLLYRHYGCYFPY